MYVYIKSEPELWTVGFYEPDGRWNPESDYSKSEAAAARVNFLNGGGNESLEARVEKLERQRDAGDEGAEFRRERDRK